MTKKPNDFDPNELIKASEDHEKSLADLRLVVSRLDKRVGNDATLAASFKNAFENDKKMDTVLTSLIKDLILKDDDLRAAITKAVAKVDRKWWNGAWKKALAAIGAVLLVVLGAVLQAWLG
jgi:hypothetical protein